MPIKDPLYSYLEVTERMIIMKVFHKFVWDYPLSQILFEFEVLEKP